MPVRFVISVLVADRVGILRDITSAVADMGANVDGISQTVVSGYFTVILTASFAAEREADEVRDHILANFPRGEAAALVRPYDPSAAGRRPVTGDRYVVSLIGRDRPGILKAVTGFLADKNVNIEDWYVLFEGEQVTHIGEVVVPRQLDIRQFQNDLQLVLTPLGLTCKVQHENIFRATNEVGPFQTLMETSDDRRR